MTDKQLGARIRMLRRLGVTEFEADGLRVVLGALEPTERRSPPTTVAATPPVDDEAEDLAGMPGQFWADYQAGKLKKARDEAAAQ